MKQEKKTLPSGNYWTEYESGSGKRRTKNGSGAGSSTLSQNEEPKPGGRPGRDTMATCRLKMASRKTSEECCGNMAASVERHRLHGRSTGFSAF